MGWPEGVPEELLASKGYLYIVADGVGGHQAGEVASGIAVDVIRRSYYEDLNPDAETSLRRAILDANEEILRQAQEAAWAGMGTTVVAAVVRGDELVIAHVGDSRAYLWREGHLQRLTADHTWVAERLAAGILTPEEAANHPMRHVLTRSLGSAHEVAVDVARYDFRPSDRFLLCTDGVWEVLPEDEMARILGRADPQMAAAALVNRALESGGQDDATALIVAYPAARPARASGILSALPLWAWGLIGLAALFVAGLLCGTPLLVGAIRRWPTPTVPPSPTAQIAGMVGVSITPTTATPTPSPVPSPAPPPIWTPTPSPSPTLPPQEYAFQNPMCVSPEKKNPTRGKALYLSQDDYAGKCVLPVGEAVDVIECEQDSSWCWVGVPTRRLQELCPDAWHYYPSQNGWSLGWIPRFRLMECPEQ
jgi:protein phosphatase